MRTLSALAVSTLLLGACAGTDPGAENDDLPTVVTSIYPIAWVAQQVAGEGARIVDVTPPGVEPHDLELSTSQAIELNEADLIVYIGEGFQPSIEDALSDIDTLALDVLTDVETHESDHAEDEEGHGEQEEDEHEGEEGGVDPHVWLDPSNMETIAGLIARELSKIAPDSAPVYRDNAEEVSKALHALDEEMRSGLERCERREIVVSHEAFGYLTEAYGLEQVGISGLDPEAEPSPARLAEVQEFAREHGVTTIFFEELVSPATAETLASELSIDTAVLSPLETAPENGDYLDAMRANLETLRDALGCD